MKRLRASAFFLIVAFCLPGVIGASSFPSAQTSPVSAQPSPASYDTLFAQGEKLRLAGEFESALALFEDAAALAAKSGFPRGEAESRLKLGLLYWNLGRMAESRAAYEQALSLAKRSSLDDLAASSSAAVSIAGLYADAKALLDREEYSPSIETFKKAIDLAAKIDSPDHELKCLRQMSRNYWYLDDFEEFRRLNETALAIARRIRNKKDEGICLNNIGLYHWKTSEYSKALAHYDQALAIARAVKNPQSENECLNNMGIVYQEVGDYDKALAVLNRALELDRQAFGRDYIAIDLNNIGIVYRKKGVLTGGEEDFRKALEYFHKALDLIDAAKNRQTAVNILNDIGAVHADQGEYAEALKYFERALSIAEGASDKEGISLSANNLGIVHYNLGDYDKASTYSRRAIDIAVQIQAGHVLWEALLELANGARKQGRLDEALNYYKDSISVIENARSSLALEELKASYLGTDKRIEAYHNLIDTLVRLHQADPAKGYDAQAFLYLERAKARAFLDSIEVAQVPLVQGIDYRLAREEKRLSRELEDLYKKLLEPNLASAQKAAAAENISRVEDEYDELKRGIRSSNPAYAGLKYPEVISLAEAQTTLASAGTTCICYLVGKEASYGFAVNGTGLRIYPLPPRKELQAKVSAYLKVISDKDASDFSAGRDLFALLVAPGLTPDTKRLILVPGDILHYLPFEALRRPGGGGNGGDTGRGNTSGGSGVNRDSWLVEDCAVSYAPSLSSLREIILRAQQSGPTPKKDLLAFGDPDYGSAAKAGAFTAFENFYSSPAFRFFPLKFSAAEVERIAALFSSRRADVYLGKRATEDALQALALGDYKIIHFAAHGLVDDQRPARSSIVLSLDPASPEDGFVQVREIYNLRMRASLVGLSACQTALGRFVRGEGIEGLNRAFFYAGASSVLMTLWAVNDEAGAQLMERFYRRLRASDPITDALRGAKLDMIRSPAFAHPYYWAGYVVTGDTAQSALRRKPNIFLLLAVAAVALAAIILLSLSPRIGSSSSARKRARSTTAEKRR